MPNQLKNQSFYNLSENILQNQSILDVFVLQNILDPEDADTLKRRFRTAREIENYLTSNKLVTRDTVNKAYSIILKLPYVELKSFKIPEELLQIIPEKAARKFGIIPFGIEEKTIKIAMSRPADLLMSYQSGLIALVSAKGIDIELFLTGESDFIEAIKQYDKRSPNVLLKKSSLPVVFLRNQIIGGNFLSKIPKEFIEKYRILVFGQNKNDYYLIACEKPDDPVTLKILDYISKTNGIKYELFATSKEDIDHVLSLLDGKKSKSSLPTDGVIESDGKANAPFKTDKNAKLSTGDKPTDSLQNLFNALVGPKDDFSIDEIPNLDLLDAQIDQEKEAAAPEAAPNNSLDSVPENTSETSTEAQPEISAIPNTIPAKEEVVATPKPEVQETKEEAEAEVPDAITPIDKIASSLDNNDIGGLIGSDIQTKDELETIAKEGNIPKIVAAIINFALNQRASDVHVEPEAKTLRIRVRIDGILVDVLKLPPKFQPPFLSRIKIMSKLKIDETRIPQDGRFDIVLNGRQVDVRVSTLPTVHGEKVVLRVLDKSQGILSLEDLGMVGSAFDKTIDSIGKPFGIILSTGPTGSGKSTTLYAILNRISLPGVNIVTLEDPVEYEIAGINQCQIKPEIGFTFASGLRSILRQDPNVIMVGEIRDAETAQMSTHAALTGHLVLSTLHTNDAAGALPRLINMGIEPFLITSSINLVIAQRLVRRICPKCREEMHVPDKLMEQLKAEIAKIPASNVKDTARIPQDFKLFYGKGCSECNKGYKGRVGLFEAMTIDSEVEDLAIAKRPANDIKEVAVKGGMITMKQDGILKAFAGLTTIDEVFQAVINN